MCVALSRLSLCSVTVAFLAERAAGRGMAEGVLPPQQLHDYLVYARMVPYVLCTCAWFSVVPIIETVVFRGGREALGGAARSETRGLVIHARLQQHRR